MPVLSLAQISAATLVLCSAYLSDKNRHQHQHITLSMIIRRADGSSSSSSIEPARMGESFVRKRLMTLIRNHVAGDSVFLAHDPFPVFFPRFGAAFAYASAKHGSYLTTLGRFHERGLTRYGFYGRERGREKECNLR